MTDQFPLPVNFVKVARGSSRPFSHSCVLKSDNITHGIVARVDFVIVRELFVNDDPVGGGHFYKFVKETLEEIDALLSHDHPIIKTIRQVDISITNCVHITYDATFIDKDGDFVAAAKRTNDVIILDGIGVQSVHNGPQGFFMGPSEPAEPITPASYTHNGREITSIIAPLLGIDTSEVYQQKALLIFEGIDAALQNCDMSREITSFAIGQVIFPESRLINKKHPPALDTKP